MTRSTARRILRRRLNEVSADNWQDSDLNETLDIAVHKMQTKIMAVDPLAFMYIDSTPIVSGQEFYPKPNGFWYEFLFRIKNISSGLYEDVKKRDYTFATSLAAGSTQVYSHVGRHFALRPIPSANLAAGIQLIYVPTLSMATDAEDIPIHFGLHDAVVKQAEVLLLPETGEAYKDVATLLAADVADIPLYYRQSAGEMEQFNPEVPKDY